MPEGANTGASKRYKSLRGFSDFVFTVFHHLDSGFFAAVGYVHPAKLLAPMVAWVTFISIGYLN
jgi:hypothetical protein